MLRLGCTQISAKGSPRENGLAHLGAIRPDSNLRTHQAGESAASSKRPAAGARQGNLRKELGLGDSNFGIRRDKDLLGFANVGPPLDERGRQARWHFGGKRLLYQRPSARHSLRVVAKENTDGIFLLRDLPLQVRNLGVCGIENLLSLQDVKLGGHAMLDAKIGELHRVFLRLNRLARDLKLQIKLQEREIVAGHVAHER